ncbi:MAG: hypothetical protein ACRCUC_07315 [Aestuariivirga sp.]
MALFGGLFGERFRENWQGTAEKAGLADKLGVLGVGISQLSAGQAPNILPAWQAVEDRRAKRKLGEAMGNPELLAGFTPEQRAMLAVMPPELAQSLIAEKIFAPPPAPLKPEYREFGGDLYDMSSGAPTVVLDGMGEAELAEQEAAAARRTREADAEMLGYVRGSPEFNQYVVTGEMVKPQADPIADLRARALAAGFIEGSPEYRQFMATNGEASDGMVFESDGQGGFRMVQGAGAAAAAAKPFTEGQSKDIVFATRARGALETLDPIAGALTSRTEVASDWLPMGLGGSLQTDEYQVAKTAGDEFLQAILRKDTGAAITPSEQSLYGETYLPRPGDTEARLRFKAEARQRAVAALEAGMSASQIVAQEKAMAASAATDTQAPDADGWQTMPNGVKIRVKP